MTLRAGACPNCGAPIEFRWSGAVQTVCVHCQSVVVRHDVNLEALGKVSELPKDSSPIQIGTEGRWNDRPFTVIGRIVYEHDDGGWNEWHLIFANGESGWLSDAQAEYAISELAAPAALPAIESVSVGDRHSFHGRPFTVASITNARYRGVEGELPFVYWDKDTVPFVDLRAHDESFATIDYSEPRPLLFIGRFVEYDALALRNARTFDERTAVDGTLGFNCKNCGAAVELRALRHTLSVACTSCAAILDPNDPTLAILQKEAKLNRIVPTIPLGSRGVLRGRRAEVIGFQQRSIKVEGTTYGWNEYVLFDPYQGFRYLSEYQGHWSDIRSIHALPAVSSRTRPTATYREGTFRHFQSATATTEFVLGEFPWRVEVEDRVEVADFVAPPFMLSREGTKSEATWSLGEYTTGEQIWQAFALPGEAPDPIGVFAHQPSPYAGRTAGYLRTFVALALVLLLLLAGRSLTAAREQVFAHDYAFQPRATAEAAFVTEPFTLREAGTIQFEIETSVNNSWAYFDLALIDTKTGTALNVAREVSRYSGVDQDGSWSEGSAGASILIPRVPAGEYYLRVEPEGDQTNPNIQYRLRVRRDVVSLWPYLIALFLLGVGPAWHLIRSASFENRRWQESDHGA
jgi:Domain of unknown function (DUF4178)